MDVSNVVKFVDDFKDLCPGSVNGNRLVQIGIQKERRLLVLKRVKHIIFREGNTRNIWYKNTVCYPSVVAMGFKAADLRFHPKAVSMEAYAKYFLDNSDPEWLKKNDFELSK